MKLKLNDLMKYLIIILMVVFTFSFFYSCKSEKNVKADLIVKNGLIYKNGSNVPYTGKEKAKVYKRTIEYDVVNGKKNGEFKILFLNGKPEMIGQMVDNSNEGLWKYFYPNAQVESEGNFKNNMVDGRWTWYYENGSLKEEGKYLKGKREGEWISYKKDGSISEKKIFKDGNEVSTNSIKNLKSKKLPY
ncbi:MAG: hypothetical protein M1480_11300 [Bacteroidetes bacterium]|nr:hypothetical protein [Bacteroidota bacterium]